MFTAYEIIIRIVKIYSALFAKAVVHGCFPLPAGAKIIAANHTIVSDGLQLPLAIKEKLHFLVQADLFTLPILGRLMHRAGQIPVEQEEDKPYMAIKHASRLLRNGKTIVVFPEGRLVPPGERLPAHNGAIRLALQTGAPIIPVGMYTPPNLVTPISIQRLGKKRTGLWQTSGWCHLNFGAPWIPRSSAHNKEQIPMLTEELMNKIYTLVAETKKELACVSSALLKPTPQL